MYFDNAATSFPKPEEVYRVTDRFLRTAAANPGRSGHRMSVEAERTVARARGQAARLLNVPDPARIVWTSNGTAALNLALKGWLRPGDRVVTTALEHNSVVRPLRRLKALGVEVTRVEAPGGRFDLALFRRAIRPGTRLVVMTHASNVTGELLPAGEVGAHCRREGVPLLLDAAQTAGSVPLDARALGADLIAAPGHKGLFGPPGTGLLAVGEALELLPLVEGGTGSLSEEEHQPPLLPDRLESGTLNTVGIAGLGVGIDWIRSTGVETIHRREMELVEQLWAGLSSIAGVTLHGPAPGPERAAVVSFTLEGWEPTDAALVLDERFDVQCRPGLHCAPWAHQSLGTFPTGTIRLSPGFFNTEAEVESTVAAVRALAG